MIDLARTRFIVTSWPRARWSIEVMSFIEVMMRDVQPVRKDYRSSVVKKDRTCARNTAIRDYALRAPEEFQHFIFIDEDVRPQEATPQFLELTADVVSCQVPMENKTAWSKPDSFHEAFWFTSRHVLQAIKPPWFMQGYSADGCDLSGCICKSFRAKVLEAGFTIAHGGGAEHDRDGSWGG